jgi:hypothetical protein
MRERLITEYHKPLTADDSLTAEFFAPKTKPKSLFKTPTMKADAEYSHRVKK